MDTLHYSITLLSDSKMWAANLCDQERNCQNKSKQAPQIADFGAAYHEENKLEKMIIIKQMNLSWFTEIVPTATGKHPAENKRASLSLSSLICTTKSISTSLICTKLDISFIKEGI